MLKQFITQWYLAKTGVHISPPCAAVQLPQLLLPKCYDLISPKNLVQAMVFNIEGSEVWALNPSSLISSAALSQSCNFEVL